jgi:lysophospholipase L1-like esterase
MQCSRLPHVAFLTVALLAASSVRAADAPTDKPAESRTPSPSLRWEKEIRAFEAADAKSPPPKGAVLFIGSSTIRMWKTLAKDFPDQTVINRGFGGSEIADCTDYADRIVVPYQPAAIFLRSGSNDLNAGRSPEQVSADFKAFVAKVRAKLPDTEIVYISLCPSIARAAQAEKTKQLNALVETFLRTAPHTKYIDSYDLAFGADGKLRPELFAADKLHFNAAGYKLLAARVRPYLPATNASTAAPADSPAVSEPKR